MGRLNRIFVGIIGGVAAAFGASCVDAAPPVNPREDSQSAQYSATRTDSSVSRRATSGTVRSRTATTGRGSAVGVRTAMPTASVVSRSGRMGTAVKSRAATQSVSRAAKPVKSATQARSVKSVVSKIGGLARSGLARATAIFSDVTKIGSGYAQCRESYSTCMDQMCANANDTYRRCFCSERFETFRDIEESLDEAMIMLRKFEDNNLNVIDKTAAEVDAMYSPTVGEQAIKKDTSAAAKALDSINDLLSGKVTKSSGGYSTSLGILDLDFSTDLDDIWTDGGSSLFDSNQDLSTLEGKELFSAAQKQCVRLSQNMCESTAVSNVAKSAYNILITQDCNTYEKKLNTKKETVAKALREAEKYLREARLEEYRAHNSDNVNECLAKVRKAMFADTACGENYKRCLDPTGAYVNSEGNVIYSPRLFELENLITLSGDMSDDVSKLGSNALFDKRLEEYRKYVTAELDTCRNIADFVWTEFKRTALIEIAQAQSEKIEETKAECVGIISECYDTTTNSLKNMDKKTAVVAGAIGRFAAADMCREQVAACASLYKKPDADTCNFDSNGHLEGSSLTGCGLASLIEYVQVVDSWNVANSCEEAVEAYMLDLCGDDDTEYGYPYLCRSRTSDELADLVHSFVLENCVNPSDSNRPTTWEAFASSNSKIKTKVDKMVSEVSNGMRAVLSDICEDKDGYWVHADDPDFAATSTTRLSAFYNEVTSGGTNATDIAQWGECVVPTEKLICLAYNRNETEEMTSWNDALKECTFYDAWYIKRCEEIDGYFSNNMCYVEDD